jgi:hypothetical protein
MTTLSRARGDAECICSHPYRDHRQKRALQIATVCAKCQCIGFTPRNQQAWNRLLAGRA